MSEPITIEGKWRIEGEDQDSHYGVLNFDPLSGLELVVKIPQDIGVAEVFGAVAKPPDVPNTIFGQTKDNFPVSLFGCRVTNFDSSGGLKSYTISAMIGLVGREVVASLFSGLRQIYSRDTSHDKVSRAEEPRNYPTGQESGHYVRISPKTETHAHTRRT